MEDTYAEFVPTARCPSLVVDDSRPALGAGDPLGDGLSSAPHQEDRTMLMTFAMILLVLWVLGLVSSYTIGGFIHVLLIVAIVLFLVRVIQGRRPVL